MKQFMGVLCILLFVLSPVSAAELKGVKMADTIEVGGQALVLNGMALRTKVVFKVYVAGLYLEEKSSDSQAILASDQSKRVVMHFLRNVDKEKINGAWFDGLEDNTPGFSPELKAKFDRLATMMEDMKKDGEITFTYLAATGTQVMVNDRVKGEIDGKEFMTALFSCWIGEKPGPGKKFKQNLLGI